MPRNNIRRKAQLGLDIREGGIAIPIAPNMYYMNGRSHDEGGIGIGPNNKNGLEVEGGEVVKVGDKDIKVFSSVPLLRGVSPAELVMGGANPNKVFKAQEDFKDRNRINDDGTRYQNGGNKVIKYENLPSSFKGKYVNGRILQGGVPPVLSKGELAMGNPLQRMGMWSDDLGEFSKYMARRIHKFVPKKVDTAYRYVVDYLSNKGPNNAIDNNAENLTKAISLFNAHEYKTGGIYIKPSKRGTFTAAAKKHGMGVQEFASKVLANKEDYSPAMVKKANFARNASRWKKELGGRVKAEIGTYQPKRNNKGQIVLNPNNPDDVRWLREQQGKRGAKAVHKGQQEFLEGTLNRTTPIMLGIATANPIITATSLAGSYLLGEVGKVGGKLYKSLTGEDYTKEGKVIGQTIGGLGGPIGAKLFGKGATNAWNAYKSNRLNSTQTLVDAPELGLTIRPNVRTNRPKQLDVTNNQKYLPTDVEDLTWKEPKALLETQAQVTRRDLKNFNRWAKLFGYEPVPLRYAETKSIADRHVQDRIRQHNTFLRGVAKPNKLQKQAIEYELAKEGITNPTDYDVYNYMATHSAPSTGAGRADLRPIQVKKRKVGNFNLSKTSDSPIGALYTQGSGRGAAGYAGMGPESRGHRRTGVVVEVARPTHFRPGASYAEWVKENDFNFGDVRSKGFHEKVANRVVEGAKVSQNYALSDVQKKDIIDRANFILRDMYFKDINEASNYVKTMAKSMSFSTQYRGRHGDIFKVADKVYQSWDIPTKIAYTQYLKTVSNTPNEFKIDSFKRFLNRYKDIFKATYYNEIKSESKKARREWLSKDVDYNPEDYTQPDYSVLKSTTRNKGNAQQHYIFRAPIGEKILEGRGFYLPTEEEIINATTNHYSLWTPGYSRNTRKFGGIKKFKFGGNMIYEINGNIKNSLMSARPKAELGTIKRHGKTWKWDEEYGAYVPIKDSKEKEPINGTFDNARPQYYAEKRLPIAGSQSIAEKAGLARSGWSYADNEPISLNYVPNINLSIPDNYGKSSTPRKGGTKSTNSKAVVASKPSAKGTDTKYGTPLAEKKESLYMTGIKNNVVTPIRAGMEKIKSHSSTGGGTQSGDGRWIGQYKPVTTADWIGLGSNLAGTVASYFMTKNAINKMPDPIKPVMAQAAKLKTRYNVEPQLTNIREAEQMNRAAVRRNTQSSNVSLAREQRLMNEARGTRNVLYGQKENIETQLINQDRLNRQSVMRDNVRAYNDYLSRLTATRQGQNQLRISNINNLLSGLTGSVNNILGTIESRRATNNTLRAIAAANPNVDARLIGGFDYYIDPITKRKYNKNQQYVGTING